MRFQLLTIIIVFMLCVIVTQSTSNEKRNRWQLEFDINGQKRTFYFDNKFDAAKKSNQIHHEMGIPPPIPQIYESPTQKKNKKTSEFEGVNWHKKTGKWYVQLAIYPEQKPKYGGMFKDEVDAAKRVNQLCAELRFPLKNPDNKIMIFILQQVTQKFKKQTADEKHKSLLWFLLDDEHNNYFLAKETIKKFLIIDYTTEIK